MNLKHFYPIIAKCSQGQRKQGVESGGSILYDNIFKYKTIRNPMSVSNNKFNTKSGYDKLYNICANTKYPLVLGGDHSIGASTVLGSLSKYPNLTVIWIDAHADINTWAESKTKNRHGMPVSTCIGLEKVWFNKKITRYLNPNNLIYVGIRDLDLFEKKTINKYNIKVYDTPTLIDFIKNTKTPIHISFDVDSLDPTILDSTGTPVPNGLTHIEVKNIINKSIDMNKLIGLDVVELNPLLGNCEKSLLALEYIFN